MTTLYPFGQWIEPSGTSATVIGPFASWFDNDGVPSQVDTAQKRYSMMNIDGFDEIMFEVDSSVDLDDRQHMLGCYGGIAFAAPAGGVTVPLLEGRMLAGGLLTMSGGL